MGGVTVVSAPGAVGRIRIGLVASSRVGTAVIRNRVKRRLRAALAEADPAVGHNYVIVATRQVADVPFRTLVKWLKTALGER